MSEKTIKTVKELWEEFGSVPMNPKAECIEEPWCSFPVGTHREEIWHWFEERFDISVTDLMYHRYDELIKTAESLNMSFDDMLMESECVENEDSWIHEKLMVYNAESLHKAAQLMALVNEKSL